ncbi:MAG: 4-hydroxy-tetrahydrodipicolinate reductase [Ethanoligenens sp.]|uniref:4-hydroxy-tetrahydrodipicolinate reductase n=1 Tax=Ethanoligenens sp. TaxID=2099655 RepID=UPI0039E91991
MLRLCVSGLGKAGIQTAKYLFGIPDVHLVSAICSPGSSKAGRDLGEIVTGMGKEVPVYPADQIEPCVFQTKPDVVIDFSTPEASLPNAAVFARMGINLVIGTTGFSEPQEELFDRIARKYPIGLIYAPNITRGVNAMMLLTEIAARILESYDFEIVEMHHKRKKDIPSGTALKIADSIENRSTSGPLRRHDIPISSVRAGGIVGIHKVMLVGENDMIELTHQSFSRDAFAEGALHAARFIQNKRGVFKMRDALQYDRVLTEFVEEHTRIPMEE